MRVPCVSVICSAAPKCSGGISSKLNAGSMQGCGTIGPCSSSLRDDVLKHVGRWHRQSRHICLHRSSSRASFRTHVQHSPWLPPSWSSLRGAGATAWQRAHPPLCPMSCASWRPPCTTPSTSRSGGAQVPNAATRAWKRVTSTRRGCWGTSRTRRRCAAQRTVTKMRPRACNSWLASSGHRPSRAAPGWTVSSLSGRSAPVRVARQGHAWCTRSEQGSHMGDESVSCDTQAPKEGKLGTCEPGWLMV